MYIDCPQCNLFFEVDSEYLKPNAKRLTCPRCRHKFGILLQSKVTPPVGTTPELKPVAATQREEQDIRTSLHIEWEPTKETSSSEDYNWENPSSNRITDYFVTAATIIFHPTQFFESMPTTGGKLRPLLFGIVTDLIMKVVAVFYFALIYKNLLIPWLSEIFPWFAPAIQHSSGTNQFTNILCSPIGFVIHAYVFGGILHGIISFCDYYASTGWEGTFRVICYSNATTLVGIIPIISIPIHFIYGPIVMIIGLVKVHGTSYHRAAVAVIIFNIMIIGGGILLGYLGYSALR